MQSGYAEGDTTLTLAWNFYGSNDGSTWAMLQWYHSGSNLPAPGPFGFTQYYLTVGGVATYSYYHWSFPFPLNWGGYSSSFPCPAISIKQLQLFR